MKSIRAIILALLIAAASFVLIKPAQAAHTDSVYVYDFKNATGVIANTATANATANLNMVGDWTSDENGTTFTGNTTDTQSTSYAKPASGPTLSVSTTQSVGAAVIFTQQGGCMTDSQNITQIGKFAANAAQVKLQLSKCAAGNMYPECRIAGALTPSSALALRGTPVLAAGNAYRLECVKGADSGAQTQVIMHTTDLAANTTTTNTFTIAATGAITSTSYLSVANKYPPATQANNTDQFKGLISKIGYCVSIDTTSVESCLASEVASNTVEPPVDPPTPAGAYDEVTYSYGDSRDQINFSWRGTETKLYYGLDSTYGSEATAIPSSTTPVDIAGPFMRVWLSGLNQGSTYHYKIGTDGQDYTFTTAAADTQNFKAVEIGDTIASTCRTYQNQMNSLVAAETASVVLHHGDIAIANECGVTAIHQYFTDIQNSYTRTTAYMPVWGNHEYGNPTANAPVGTPRDTLANYKGRLQLPNAQTVPNDTASKTSNPGCGSEISSSTNTCLGNDWGWFRNGRVLFIAFPEPWPNAITDWRTKASTLMAQAQADPTVDYIVTYGHRPVVSSTSYTAPTSWVSVFNQLSDMYAPSAANPEGKYVLNLTGHRHNMEVVQNYHGVMQVVNGGGGQGLIKFGTPVAGSTFRMKHLGYNTLAYDAAAHQLTFNMICGPLATGQDSACTPGSVVYTHTFTKP